MALGPHQQKLSESDDNMASILIVDDSMTFREELKATLAGAGFDVVEAVDGEDGLTQAEAHKVDLIISDFNMPNMDGLTMCAHLRDREVKTPIFMLTTQVNPELKARASQLGVKAWIVKPPNVAALLKGIGKMLGTS